MYKKRHTMLSDMISIMEKMKLKKQGNKYSMRCFFHDEITPSMTIDHIRGTYHCFGCGKSGLIEEIKFYGLCSEET